jgi:hypothetical protein
MINCITSLKVRCAFTLAFEVRTLLINLTRRLTAITRTLGRSPLLRQSLPSLHSTSRSRYLTNSCDGRNVLLRSLRIQSFSITAFPSTSTGTWGICKRRCYSSPRQRTWPNFKFSPQPLDRTSSSAHCERVVDCVLTPTDTILASWSKFQNHQKW